MRHFHYTGKVEETGTCLPHAVSEIYKNQSEFISASVLFHHQLTGEQHGPFLYPSLLFVTKGGAEQQNTVKTFLRIHRR